MFSYVPVSGQYFWPITLHLVSTCLQVPDSPLVFSSVYPHRSDLLLSLLLPASHSWCHQPQWGAAYSLPFPAVTVTSYHPSDGMSLPLSGEDILPAGDKLFPLARYGLSSPMLALASSLLPGILKCSDAHCCTASPRRQMWRRKQQSEVDKGTGTGVTPSWHDPRPYRESESGLSAPQLPLDLSPLEGDTAPTSQVTMRRQWSEIHTAFAQQALGKRQLLPPL
jgi:hypothetical protein